MSIFDQFDAEEVRVIARLDIEVLMASEWLSKHDVGSMHKKLIESILALMHQETLEGNIPEVNICNNSIKNLYPHYEYIDNCKILSSVFEVHVGATNLTKGNFFQKKGKIIQLSNVYCWNEPRFYRGCSKLLKVKS
jgi:hypothetical protein